jgi:hypothetical protein
MKSPFYGARLKIERAKKHIRDLNALLVSEVVQGHLHAIRVESDPDTNCDSLKFEFSQAVPEELMCIVGDALHNLRTALDFVANDIEFATTGQRTKHTKFPVFDTQKCLIDAINGGFKHKAPEGVVNFIVDVVQPYETGDGNPIWALHALDIEDKHRLLIPHLQWQWIRNIRYKDESGEVFVVPEWAATGEHMPDFPTGKRNVEVTGKGNSTVSIVFAHGLPLGGKHIYPTLSKLALVVSRTIDDIERVFLERVAKV